MSGTTPAAPITPATPAANGGAAPPTVDPAVAPAIQHVPPPPEIAAALSRAAQREAAARAQLEQLEAQRKQVDERAKKFDTEAAELQRLRALKNNPLALARELGMTPHQFLEAAAKYDGAPDPATIAAAQEAKAKTEDLEKRLTERDKRDEAARVDAVRVQLQGRIGALMEKGGEKYEFLRSEGVSTAEILERARQLVAIERRYISSPADEDKVFEEVMDLAEAHLEKKYEKVKASPKWGKKFSVAPEMDPKAAAGGKPKTQPSTLNNSMSTATPPAAEKKKRWSRDDDLAMVKEKWATHIAQNSGREEKKP